MGTPQAVAGGEADAGLLNEHRRPRIGELSDRDLAGTTVGPLIGNPDSGMNQPGRPSVSTHDEMVDAPRGVFGCQLDERTASMEKMELRLVLGGEPLGSAAKLGEATRPVFVQADDDSGHRHPL